MDNHSSKLPERSRPSKACSHKSTIWKEDSVSCNPSNQSSKTPSRPSKRSLMSEVWARSEELEAILLMNEPSGTYLTIISLMPAPHRDPSNRDIV